MFHLFCQLVWWVKAFSSRIKFNYTHNHHLIGLNWPLRLCYRLLLREIEATFCLTRWHFFKIATHQIVGILRCYIFSYLQKIEFSKESFSNTIFSKLENLDIYKSFLIWHYLPFFCATLSPIMLIWFLLLRPRLFE